MSQLKSIVCLWVIVSFAHTTAAQYYFYDDERLETALLWEAGGSVGVMNCFTDLGGRKGIGKGFVKDLNRQHYNFAGGFYIGALFQQAIGGRLEATFGKVSASDKVLEGDRSAARARYQRNLHFRSRIAELALLAELHPLTFFQSSGQGPSYFSPYMIGGIGVFRFKPEAFTGQEWVALQPMRTEGQGFAQYPDRKPYQLTQVNFPLGIGVRYEVSALLNARLEVVHRILNTDYLDDVSREYIDPALFANNPAVPSAELAAQLADRRRELHPSTLTRAGEKRGNSAHNDAYFTVQVKLGLHIGRMKRGL